MSLRLVHSVPVADTATDGGDVKPKIVDKVRGPYINPSVLAWENLQRLASGARCHAWSTDTVDSFIGQARDLVGCCIAGDVDSGPITADKFDGVVVAALKRINEHHGAGRYR